MGADRIGQFRVMHGGRELVEALRAHGLHVEMHVDASYTSMHVSRQSGTRVDDDPCLLAWVSRCRDLAAPGEYVVALNADTDLIVVPSTLMRKTLIDNGVRVPVLAVGCAFDHLLDATPRAPQVPLRAFRFLHVSSSALEDGTDALLWAFGKAFRRTDDACLVILAEPGARDECEAQFRRWRRHDPDFPDVAVVDRKSDAEDMAGWYSMCHAFVAPGRSVGYNPHIAEAMLFGLPVVATGWTGQNDAVNAATAWLCDFIFSRSTPLHGSLPSVWAEPDIHHLTELMQTVYKTSPSERESRTGPARKRVLQACTRDRIVRSIECALHAMTSESGSCHEPHIGWLSTWNKRCGVAAYSSYLTAAFPAGRLTILAAHADERTGTDGENVVRCWTEGGQDSMDEVLATVVDRAIDVVVIQYNFGFFPVEVLGDLVRRLTARGIAVHCFFHATGDLVWAGRTFSLRDIANDLRGADRLFVHGIQDANRLKAMGLSDNVTLFPQGVLAAQDTGAPVRHDVGVFAGKRVLASYGFLLPHKGIRQLICAFGELARADADLHLLLLNALYPVRESEDERAACEALIESIGLEDRITFITEFLPEDECIALLRLADLIVYPYQRTQESSSAAVRMGLAARRPIAVTPLAIFDDVQDAVHTLPGTEAAAIEKGIRNLLESPEIIREQTIRTDQWILVRQWPRLSVRLLNAIDELAARDCRGNEHALVENFPN